MLASGIIIICLNGYVPHSIELAGNFYWSRNKLGKTNIPKVQGDLSCDIVCNSSSSRLVVENIGEKLCFLSPKCTHVFRHFLFSNGELSWCGERNCLKT